MGISRFEVTAGRGFHMTFENGWTISVQFGAGTYTENYEMPFPPLDKPPYKLESGDAEVAVYAWRQAELYNHPDFEGDNVGSHYSANQVLKLMNWAASQ